jgi:hypothetical protein
MALASASASFKAATASTPMTSGNQESAASAFLAALENSCLGEAAHPDEVRAASSGAAATEGNSRVMLGENGNPIFTYRTEHVSPERVLQILNDMTRLSKDTWDDPEIVTMRTKLRETLTSTYGILFDRVYSINIKQRDIAIDVARMLAQAVGYTRDIVDGKQERTLAYLLIAEHYEVCPHLAIRMVRHLVRLHTISHNGDVVSLEKGHQYGSWHDVKRLAAFMRDHYGATVEHPLISEGLDVLAEQLRQDVAHMTSGNDSDMSQISLAARHSPKSTGAAKWLYRELALRVFPYDKTASTPVKLEAAGRKAERDLRTQILVPLNRLLNTVEVMMSSKESEWHNIDFGKLPSQALRRHVKAWQNKTKSGETRYAGNEDRIECAKNYEEHMARVAGGSGKVNGARCGVAELVRDVRAIGGSDLTEEARINGQWESKLATIPSLGKCIPMVDLSGSMGTALAGAKEITCEMAAIGLGLMIAEKCAAPFANQCITFATDPKFCTFGAGMGFVERVRHIRNQNNGITTDFRKACKAILDAAVSANMAPDFFEDFVLFVLSDMQINSCSMAPWTPDLAAEVQQMFATAGKRSKHAKPFAAPHIVMWNLASTNAIATSAGLVNATSIAGYSDALLKVFESEGIQGLLNATPIATLRKQLNNSRYDPLRREFEHAYTNLKTTPV